MMSVMGRIAATSAPPAVAPIRLMVGEVLLSGRIRGFLSPGGLGVSRFAPIGFSSPRLAASYVAGFEMSWGTILRLGLLTRLAVISTLVIVVAIATMTASIPQGLGFRCMAPGSRSGRAMLPGFLSLPLAGIGPWSLARILLQRDGHGDGDG